MENVKDHSYEEIRAAALDVLSERERVSHPPNQYGHLVLGVAETFARRESGDPNYEPVRDRTFRPRLTERDADVFLEVFWDLFRQGIITLGINSDNREFPFCRLSRMGKRIVENQDTYFFHDVSTYERLIRQQIPTIDPTTLIYLKEAMQAFRSGCILSSTVMLGVATEHTFELLMETVSSSPDHAAHFKKALAERTVLRRFNKFRSLLEPLTNSLPSRVKEDLDTHFGGILSVVRTFRNQSGHPTGLIVEREQAYVLLQLFIPFCKKMYALMGHFSGKSA